MKRLQQWFDLIAGIGHEEQARLARAHAIFCQRGPNIELLSLPACWRRQPRIGR